MLSDFSHQVARGEDLLHSDVKRCVSALTSPAVDVNSKTDFLRALHRKRETAEEIAAFAQCLLDLSIDPRIDPSELSGPLLDICGTGGDRLNLFNVSTTSMFVLAAGGVCVAKHGSRGVTSRSGAADVLEALGVKVDLPPGFARDCIKEVGACFLFAPNYHPCFKAVAPARQALSREGLSTIFNLLGPLLNPARPSYQLAGVFSALLLPKYAIVLQSMSRSTAWAVCGRTADGMPVDELSTMGPSDICVVSPTGIVHRRITAGEFGFRSATATDLKGGGARENAAILKSILDGSDRGRRRDIVVLNAAAGFVVAGVACNLGQGVELAERMIDEGCALKKLHQLQRFGVN